MNPLKLTFTANEQALTKTDNFTDFASNTVSYIEATFTLGENWTGYDSVRAVWKTDYYTISTVLDANFTCVVPTEVLRYKAKVFVNLVGSIVENDALTDRLTTFPVLALTVKANAAVDGTETVPVTPSQFEQFVEAVQDAAGSISDYSYDSEAWAVGKRGGVDVPSTDETYHNNSKYWAEQNAGLSDEVADLKIEKINSFTNVPFSIDNTLIYASNGTYTSQNGTSATNRYPCSEGTLVEFFGKSFIWNGSAITALIAFYDENLRFISCVSKINDESASVVGKVSATAPQGTAFVAASTNNSNSGVGFSDYFHVFDVEYASKESVDSIDHALKGYAPFDFSDFVISGKYFSYDALQEGSAENANYAKVPFFSGDEFKITVPKSTSFYPAFYVYASRGTKGVIVPSGDGGEDVAFTAEDNGTLYLNYFVSDEDTVAIKKYDVSYIKQAVSAKLNKMNVAAEIYKSEIESGSLQTAQMVVTPWLPGVAYLHKIPVFPNENIEVIGQELSGIIYQYRFGFYDQTGSYVSQISFTSKCKVKVPSDCYNLSVGLYACDSSTGEIIEDYNLYGHLSNGVAISVVYLERWKIDYTSADDVKKIIAHSGISSNSGIVELNADVKTKLLQAKRPINNSSNAYLTETQPLVLLHFSDIHADVVELQRAVDFRDEYTDMIDDSICTGDMVSERWDNGFSYWGGVSGAENIMLCIGNHDVLTDPSGWDWTQRATQADQYSRYFAPYISNWNCTYESGKTYYYKDYANKEIRMIVLNCMLENDDNTAQLSWFANALSGALANGYSVIVANHYMVANAEKVACNFSSVDCGVGSSVLPVAYLTTIQNYINDGGNFVCHIVGHTHNDLVVKSEDYPNQICIVIDALNRTQGNQYSDTQRTDGTKSQDLANLFVVDTASKVIKIIRVGADMDHYLREKHCITIDYSNGNIVSQN